MSSFRLLVHNAKQLVLVSQDAAVTRKVGKEEMNAIDVIDNGSMVVSSDGLVRDVGSAAEIDEKYKDATFEQRLDASGLVIVPGLVDGHTHPVWSGDRVHEFAMKLAGATYMDIHKMGGGIGFTVEHTRKSSEQELEALLLKRLDRMLKCGTTLVEAKSGYGLETDTELKMLRVLHTANQKHSVDIVSNFLGAHSVPKGSTAQAACEEIVNVTLPKIAQLKQLGELSVEFIDVFHEKGVFETPETRRILQAGREAGLKINFHGDELHHVGAGELGGELSVTAISHLEWVSDAGIEAMRQSSVIGVLLPTTAYVLRIEPPPARRLIDSGVCVALGSDFNPNAHCVSMPMTMNLACVSMRMTLPEALNAATINAAASMDRGRTHGTLARGRVADFLVLEANSWEHLVYEMVDPPVSAVYKRGKCVLQL